MAAHLVSGAPGSIIWLRFYLPCCWGRQQDLNLRTLNVTTAAEPAQLCLHISSQLRFAFSSAAHCFCGLTVRRCGHSLCALNFSRFLDRWPGWCSIAVLPCFSASGNTLRHSLWSPLARHLCCVWGISPDKVPCGRKRFNVFIVFEIML